MTGGGAIARLITHRTSAKQRRLAMYQISRALYRSIVRRGAHRRRVRSRRQLPEDPRGVRGDGLPARHRPLLLRVSGAHPVPRDPLVLPVVAQTRVYRIIEEHLNGLARRFADDPELVFALTGHRMRGRAWARKGRPCGRRLGRHGYCPSHKHLAGRLRRLEGRPDDPMHRRRMMTRSVSKCCATTASQQRMLHRQTSEPHRDDH